MASTRSLFLQKAQPQIELPQVRDKSVRVKEIEDAAVAEERLRRTAEAEAAQKLRTSQALEAELTAAEASGQRELAEASKKKDEALARLASSAGTREAAAGRLQAVESRVERKMREAELRAEETQSSLVQQHRTYECQAKEDLEHFKAAMDHRAVAAEELVAAARERRRLEGLSAKELEAGLKMSRQLMQHAFPCAQSAALREAEELWDAFEEEEESLASEARQLEEELKRRLMEIQREEQKVQEATEKALETLQQQRAREEQEDSNRLTGTENLEAQLLSEQLAVEEEVYAFEAVEEEAASRARRALETQLSEAQASGEALATRSAEALQRLTEELGVFEALALEASQEASRAEAELKATQEEHAARAEAAERHHDLRAAALQEEVWAAQVASQQVAAHEASCARQLEEEAMAATDRCLRGSWEEIAASRLEAAQQGAQARREEAQLSLEAEEFLDEVARMEVAVRRMQDSELAEERSARELRHATSEVKSALGQILEESQLQEAQLEEETLEAEAEICREEAQQLARLELQWQQAEHRAEAAALRYQEAAESEAASQQQYQQELEELKQRGDKKESKIRRQRLAAEEALAQAMTWCDQQSQLSLRLLRGDAPELTQDSDRCSQITDT